MAEFSMVEPTLGTDGFQVVWHHKRGLDGRWSLERYWVKLRTALAVRRKTTDTCPPSKYQLYRKKSFAEDGTDGSAASSAVRITSYSGQQFL